MCGNVGAFCTIPLRKIVFITLLLNLYSFIYSCLVCPTSPTFPHFQNRQLLSAKTVICTDVFTKYQNYFVQNNVGEMWEFTH